MDAPKKMDVSSMKDPPKNGHGFTGGNKLTESEADCRSNLITIWLFNIAMENHQF